MPGGGLGQRSMVVTIPAPYAGWNAYDALTAMQPNEAVRLENFIPDTSGVRTRDGYSTWATGVGTRVDSLMQYSGPTANKLFAASSGGKIMEVTLQSTATNTCSTVFSNGQFQNVMMGTPAGNYLIVCNGADKPFKFDGSNWSTATITGCTAGSSTFANVAIHQNRLWFTQASTLDVWFLTAAGIGGAASRLQLGGYCKKGGYILAIASWTRDGGSGMDDQIAFITSNGEAILYSGTDPTSATLWQMVGVFQIPFPVGKRCFTQVGADLALITSQGVVPFSAVLPLSPGGAGKAAVTVKITNAFQAAYSEASTNFGWQVIENSRERLLVVNVPLTQFATIQQFVMNTNTGAWCKFTGLPANCWATLGDLLYFGGTDGNVYLYGGSSADNGVTPITAIATSAFNTLGTPQIKQLLGARPMLIAPDGLEPGVGVHLDYDTTDISVPSETFSSVGSLWDSSLWDTFLWAGDLVTSANWQTLNGIGSAIALEAQVVSTEQVTYNSVDVMFEAGGYW